MNTERIKQLEKQCWRSTQSDPYAFFDVKKFAELIVQECGVALAPMLRDMISRGQAYDLIKQHFGIEQ
jgi:hypothetical protein